MKKVLAWLLVLSLTAAISIGATLAYLTDTDEDVNVMTLGKVKIDQLEYERVDNETADAAAGVQKFHDNKPLLPAVTDKDFTYTPGDTYVDWTQIGKDGYTSDIWDPSKINNEVDKMVFVKNKGDYDAFVRTVFAFEAGNYTTLDQFKSMVHLNLNTTDYTWEWMEAPVEIPNAEGGTTKYFVATATYNKVLAPGALTEISLSQIALDKTATNADVEAFGETYQIMVKSQGIQADGFEAPAVALNEGFGLVATNLPWENDNPTKGGALSTALHYLNADPTGSKITTDVTNIVFGKEADHPEIVNHYEGYLIDVEQDTEAYAYYVENSQMSKAAPTYTIYVLSENVIYAPKDSTKLFNGMTGLTGVDNTNLNTSRVESMLAMFQKCTSLTALDVSGWDTGNVTNMRGMFINCSNLQNLDLTGWDVSRVTNMSQMFMQCSSMTELNLNGWDMGNCTDLSYMFYNNPNLKTVGTKDWNTSNVNSMSAMFYLCGALENVDVSEWDTSNVTNFYVAFASCAKLKKLDVSGWDTGSATNMSAMFQSCESLTALDVSDWDVSNVTDMTCLFNKCYALSELDVSQWDTGNVISMNQTFNHCSALTELDVSQWNTANVTDMGYLFMDCRSLEELDIADWNVSKVKIFSGMFQGGGSNAMDMKLRELVVSKWNPVSATHLNHLFYGCAQLTQLDLSGWNMPNLYTTSHMFADCINLETIDMTGWQTTGSWYSMDAMFNDCRKVKTLDVSSFNTSGVVEFSQIFDACWALETIVGLENWNTANGKTFDETFLSCGSLQELNLSSWDTRNVQSGHKNLNNSVSQGFSKMFGGVNNLTKLIVSDKLSRNGNGSVSEANKLVFPNPVAKEGLAAKWQNVNTGDYYSGKDLPAEVAATYVPCYVYEGQGATMNHALHYLNADPNGTKITTKVSNIIFGRTADYAQIVDTYTGVLSDHGQERPVYAYYVPLENGCYDVYILSEGTIYAPADCTSLCSGMTNLVSFSTDNLDMSRVTTMRRMFSSDGKLQSVDADNWDTSKVTSMNGMFMSCQSLQTLDVSDWDTSEVTDMYAMFYNCKQLPTLDVGDWNVGNVTNMEFTFGGCELFVTLDVADWDVSKVTSFDAFFQSSRKTKGAMKLEYLDVSKWDTSSCVNYDRMFFWCSELKTLDMSSWNSENVTDTGSMFFNCGSLTTLYASERWSTASLTYSEGMFTGCSQLVGGNGTAFATARVTDGSYAQIDTPETPGYLTYKAAPN